MVRVRARACACVILTLPTISKREILAAWQSCGRRASCWCREPLLLPNAIPALSECVCLVEQRLSCVEHDFVVRWDARRRHATPGDETRVMHSLLFAVAAGLGLAVAALLAPVADAASAFPPEVKTYTEKEAKKFLKNLNMEWAKKTNAYYVAKWDYETDISRKTLAQEVGMAHQPPGPDSCATQCLAKAFYFSLPAEGGVRSGQVPETAAQRGGQIPTGQVFGRGYEATAVNVLEARAAWPAR